MAKYQIHDFVKGTFQITQGYGENSDYYKQFGLAGHEGVDFGTPTGTPIYTPFDGIIVRDSFDPKAYGNYVVIWDPVQCIGMWFCHLEDTSVQVGWQVKQGDLLGHTNNTGNTQGSLGHCHVNFCETDKNGVRINQDNGYQGFLNLEDTNLVEIISTPDPNGIKTFQQLKQENPGPLPSPAQQNPLPVATINYQKLFNDKRVECDINWNSFTSVVGKLGVVPDPEDKQGTVQKAGEVVDHLQTDRAGLQGEVSHLNDTILARDREIASLKQDYADLAKHNAKIQEDDSAAVLDGIQAQKQLNDIKEVLPVTPEELTKSGLYNAYKKLTAPFEQRIDNLRKTIVDLKANKPVPKVFVDTSKRSIDFVSTLLGKKEVKT